MATDLIVLQRIRNRITEYLRLLVSVEQDPPPFKTAELVNIWEDWVRMPNPEFEMPPFSEEEANALTAFAIAWAGFCDATPTWPESYAELFAHPAWPAFRDAAARTLAVLAQRGSSLED